jgi:hypothetical protein
MTEKYWEIPVGKNSNDEMLGLLIGDYPLDTIRTFCRCFRCRIQLVDLMPKTDFTVTDAYHSKTDHQSEGTA